MFGNRRDRRSGSGFLSDLSTNALDFCTIGTEIIFSFCNRRGRIIVDKGGQAFGLCTDFGTCASESFALCIDRMSNDCIVTELRSVSEFVSEPFALCIN